LSWKYSTVTEQPQNWTCNTFY